MIRSIRPARAERDSFLMLVILLPPLFVIVNRNWRAIHGDREPDDNAHPPGSADQAQASGQLVTVGDAVVKNVLSAGTAAVCCQTPRPTYKPKGSESAPAWHLGRWLAGWSLSGYSKIARTSRTIPTFAG